MPYSNLIKILAPLLVVVGLWWYISSLHEDIESRDAKIVELEKQSSLDAANYARMSNGLKQCNAGIEILKVNIGEANKKLAEWKKLPPVIRYKWRTKVMKIKSNECIDIKKSINRVRELNFNEL